MYSLYSLEVVDHWRHWDQAELPAKPRLVPKEQAQSAHKRDYPGEWDQHASERHTMMCSVFNGGWLEVACRRQNEDDGNNCRPKRLARFEYFTR